LDDIARELGISKSTVSKALSGARDVSKAMRQSVLDKAVEMGYSRTARSAEMIKIAVFITNMEYTKPEDIGYDLVVGFRKAAEPAGYEVDLIPLDQEMQKPVRYDTYMIQ
jgi:DNA-binding LacI/PurR family transcriptional regulator